MIIKEIIDKISKREYIYSQHADIERKAEGLTFIQIEEALLNGKILEQYPDTGRGESCLIIGYCRDIPIHIVCGSRHEKIVIITVYIPKPPKFITPEKRGATEDEK
jgi:hypothetical protein